MHTAALFGCIRKCIIRPRHRIRTAELAATMSAEFVAGLTGGAVCAMFPAVSFLICHFPCLGSEPRSIFPYAKVGLTAQRKIYLPDFRINFYQSPPFRVVLNRLLLKILLEIFAFHRFLSSPNHCSVKIKSLGSHLKPQTLQNHGKEN